MGERFRRAIRGEGLIAAKSNLWPATMLAVAMVVVMRAVYAESIPFGNCQSCIDGSASWWYCWVSTACCWIFNCP
jgi:hypothetical protein